MGRNTERMDLKLKSASRQVLRTVVMELGRRAGIHAHLTPHSMRHAFGDHVARHAGIKNAQALLGHADVGTTQMYTGAPTLDELAKAIEGYRFGVERTHVPPDPQIPLEAPTGIEPVYTALQARRPRAGWLSRAPGVRSTALSCGGSSRIRGTGGGTAACGSRAGRQDPDR